MEQLRKAKQERIKQERLEMQQKKQEKKRRTKEKLFKSQEEIKKRKEEKEKRKKLALVQKAETEKKSIEKLKREVFLEFNVKSVMPMIEATMKKYGEIEFSRLSPIGIQFRYKTVKAATRAQKQKNIISKLPNYYSGGDQTPCSLF